MQTGMMTRPIFEKTGDSMHYRFARFNLRKKIPDLSQYRWVAECYLARKGTWHSCSTSSSRDSPLALNLRSPLCHMVASIMQHRHTGGVVNERERERERERESFELRRWDLREGWGVGAVAWKRGELRAAWKREELREGLGKLGFTFFAIIIFCGHRITKPGN